MTTKKTAKIKDNPDLIKDLNSGAVINTNNGAYEARLAQVQKKEIRRTAISRYRRYEKADG